jgi:hypothetical protein
MGKEIHRTNALFDCSNGIRLQPNYTSVTFITLREQETYKVAGLPEILSVTGVGSYFIPHSTSTTYASHLVQTHCWCTPVITVLPREANVTLQDAESATDKHITRLYIHEYTVFNIQNEKHCQMNDLSPSTSTKNIVYFMSSRSNMRCSSLNSDWLFNT